MLISNNCSLEKQHSHYRSAEEVISIASEIKIAQNVNRYQIADFEAHPIESTEKIKSKRFIDACIDDSHKFRRSRIHFFIDQNSNFLVGFTALSTGRFDIPKARIHLPYLIIDQFSVNNLYEKQDDLTTNVGYELLDLIYRLANMLNSKYLGLRYLVIEVEDQSEIKEFFTGFGFKEIPDDWISEKIKKESARGLTRDLVYRKDSVSDKFLRKMYLDLTWGDDE